MTDVLLTEHSSERLPPQSIEAEQAILGALLINPETISKVVDVLEPEQFYRKAHQIIYAGIVDLFSDNEPIDIVTLSQFLKDQGKLDSVGGRQYLTDLALGIATTANAEYYAKTVSEKSLLRNLIKAGTEIVQSCYEDADADLVVDKAEQLIFSIAQRRSMSALIHIKDVVNESFARIEKRYENRDALSGIPTGFYDLDELTSGWQKSDLIIVAARPSMGKCLAFDSEIVLADGSVKTIEEIYKSGGGSMLTLLDNHKLGITRPSVLVDDGIKPVFRIKTRLGRTIETTLSHPFLTMEGWQPLAALAVGQHIAVPRRIPIEGSVPMQECEIKAVAEQVAGSGHSSAAELPIAVGCDVAPRTMPHQSKQLWASPKARNLTAQPENVQTIPEFIFRLPNRQLAFFLNCLFATQAASAARSAQRIAYSNLSQKLCQQMQHLLLRLGVIAKITQNNRSEWTIEINDGQSLDIFGKQIGRISARERISKSHFGLVRNDESICSDIADGDIYWDSIVSIESAGEKQVYDLTIPETHNFVANDICVHNTAFCLNVAQHCAVEAKQPVALFSLEMSKEQLVQRLLCAEARIDANKMRTGFLQSSDWQGLAAAMGRLGEAPIYIDDSAAVTALEVRAKCRRLKAEMKGLGLIIIDYIQLMSGRNRSDGNRVQEVSEISRGLKQLARELDCPVIALSQLSRAVEARQNKRPMLSDLRESGAIEQDADIVMFIYRDDYYNPESEKRGEAEIIVAKQRNGPVGTVELLYQASITRFLNKAVTNAYVQSNG